MKVFVNVKKAGSKRNALNKVEYDIPFIEATVKEIIEFFVETEVEKYNSKSKSETLIYLTEKDIDNAASEGKVHFGTIENEKKADLSKAIENALLCYEDGLVRIFKNDDELLSLDEYIDIKENDQFTFIRLTFLAGRSW